jgi:exosortase/archaeosortase family protein
VLSAALAIVALHLWSVAFFEIDGSWYAKPQLYVALCSLPVVHWGNTLFGFHLQQFATRLAGAALSLYGAAVEVDGTLLRFAHMVVAVDESCSGMRLLMGALLFGLLAQPQKRRVLFWIALFVGVLLANVMRVMALALAHLWLAGPLRRAFIRASGSVFLRSFALPCSASLSDRPKRWPDETVARRDRLGLHGRAQAAAHTGQKSTARDRAAQSVVANTANAAGAEPIGTAPCPTKNHDAGQRPAMAKAWSRSCASPAGCASITR